jgi:hypothetical protein
MHGSQGSDREVVWLDSQASGVQGPVKIHWKCWRYIDGPLFYEVRSIINDFHGKNTEAKLCRIIKDDMETVATALTDAGLSFWGEFVPSHQAYMKNPTLYDAKGVDKDHVRDEYSVSTKGVLFWLATWATTRKKHADREKVFTMLEAFLAARLPAKWFYASKISEKYDNLFNRCADRTRQDRPCRHIRHMLQNIGDDHESFSWKQFTHLMVDLSYDRDCECYQPLYEKLMDACFVQHAGGMEAVATSNILKTAVTYQTEAGKRRRIDEDFKAEMSKLNVESGIKPTTLVSFTDMGSGQMARGCQHVFLKACQLSSQKVMLCEGAVIFSEDGSGHGKPAESTSMSLIWDAEVNVCAPGQPKVYPRRKPVRELAAALLTAAFSFINNSCLI